MKGEHQEAISRCLEQLQPGTDNKRPVQVCAELAGYVIELAGSRRLDPIACCAQQIAAIYSSGNERTRIAIENEFLYRIGDTVLLCPARREIINLFPAHFRDIMIGQITRSGI